MRQIGASSFNKLRHFLENIFESPKLKQKSSKQTSIFPYRLIFLVSKISHIFILWLFMRSRLEKLIHDARPSGEGGFQLGGPGFQTFLCLSN